MTRVQAEQKRGRQHKERMSIVEKEALEKYWPFIVDFSIENGRPPTVREIGAGLNQNSTGQVMARLSKLTGHGLITKSAENGRIDWIKGYTFICVPCGTVAKSPETGRIVAIKGHADICVQEAN